MDFKVKSRFSVLLDDSRADFRSDSRADFRSEFKYKHPSHFNKYNSLSIYQNSNNFKKERFSNYRSNNSDFINKVIVENENKKREKLLNKDNFPSLSTKYICTESLPGPSHTFKDSLETHKKQPIDRELPSGWIELKKNTVFSNDDELESTISSKESVNVIDSLCKNYNKYVNIYISLWGIEEFEKMYIFPNFGYDDNDDSEQESDSEANISDIE